jgi:hypothetical protein
MAQYRIDPQVTKALWETHGGELATAAALAIDPGPAPVKGKPMKQIRIDFLTEIVRVAFESGVRIGFDRGARAYDEDADLDEPARPPSVAPEAPSSPDATG